MAFSIPNGAFQLQSTEPDVLSALHKGITGSMKPRAQAEELVKSMLANKIQGAKAKYAQQMEQANLNHILAQTPGLGDEHGMAGLRRQKLQRDLDPDAQADYIKRLSEAYSKIGGTSTGGGNDISKALIRKSMGLPSQTPEEKAALEYQQKIMLANAARKVKKQDQYEASLDALRSSIGNEQLVEDALTHTTTGILPSLGAKFGVGGSSLGELNEPATRMQAELARAISQRGGVGAASIAATGKPSQWRSNAYNQAILKPIKKRQQEEYLNIKHDWIKKTGNPFPYKFSDFYKSKSGFILMKKDGQVKKVPIDQVDEALELGARLE